ncbi:MAG: hypothetical protein ACOZCL_17210 [Bacillota bacterium]
MPEKKESPGNSENAPGQQKKEEKQNGNGNGKGNGNGNGNGKGSNNSNGNGNAYGHIKQQERNIINPLKLRKDINRYVYDGFSNDLLKEYTPAGSPLAQYYSANGYIVSKKMFGLHGYNIPGRELSPIAGEALKTTGGMAGR